MKKIIPILLIFCSLYFDTKAQEFDIFTGVAHERIFRNYSYNKINSFQPLVGLGISDVFKYKDIFWRFEASLHQTKYTYNIREGGQGSGRILNGKFTSTNLVLRALPISIRFNEKFEFNSGPILSTPLSYSDKGTSNPYGQNPYGDSLYSYNEIIRPFQQNTYGLCFRFSYRQILGKRWLLSPQYRITKIFPKNLLHSISIGIIYKRNKVD